MKLKLSSNKRNKQLDTIVKFIQKHTYYGEAFSLKQARILKDYAENCASWCSKNSYLVNQFNIVLNTLNAKLKYLDSILEEIIDMAKKHLILSALKVSQE